MISAIEKNTENGRMESDCWGSALVEVAFEKRLKRNERVSLEIPWKRAL
jgi:hypothetical protein